MATILQGATALVTGGGVGIGRAIAVGLAAEGARVALSYRSHKPEDSFLHELESASGYAPLAIRLDATNEADVESAIAQVGAEFGAINILVNNVGGLVERAPIAEMTHSLWNQVIAVNLDSLFLVTRHALAIMHADGGRIINIASLAGRNGGHAGATAYATTKAGIFGFTRGLAKELGASGATVNAIAPGFIEATPFHDRFTSAASKAATIATIPVGRAGTPEDVASAATWLASPSASFVSGIVLDVNGAQYFG
ncbi:SDR family NAD(P)-dependent oxidoreductase [Salinibacterium sp. PAMC 21357]|uniref:SDR family NAD(P)-dependent oxidoreductase n=1 Tax=Salinibacterium sp. PAMC 21357 TaxID=1112215 RepID=UPI000289CF86|nr:SDR family NAD(P)-dependent oxidoreductase [Salinibacterium sp. PAMC 21357]